MIRSRRLVHMALKHLLLPEIYERFKHKSKFTKISPDESEPVQQVNNSVAVELEDKFLNKQ